MNYLRAVFSKRCTLAAQWRALLTQAMTHLRRVTACERATPRKAFQQAELLEAWCICALTQVSLQITADGRAVQMRKPFNEQLAPIAAILMSILTHVQKIKARLQACICKVQAQPLYAPRMLDRLHRYAPPFLDSS